MTTLTQAPPEPAPPPYPVMRFTVEQYHQMIGASVFADDDRFELLEGWIIPKPMTRHPPHDGTLDLIQEWLLSVLPAGWRVRNQSAITLGDSEPESDLVVVRGSARDYLKRHPGPADIALVVEVSDSTLDKDRRLKARIYARASVPAYWIVNVAEGCIEVHDDPSGPGPSPSYRSRTIIRHENELIFRIDGHETARVVGRELLP